MVNKHLRILIADSRHTQSLLVERLLNRLGYFRIATASSLDEARTLGRVTGNPFDVLIISARLIVSEPLDCMALVGVGLNGLIYQSQYLPVQYVPLAQQGVVKRHPGPLELEALSEFMALVDPHALPLRQPSLALHP